MKYQAVIWDVDGTMLNTMAGIVGAYKYSFEKLGLPKKSTSEISSYIGPTPVTIFTEKFGMNPQAAQSASDLFRDRYKTHDLYKAEMYSGIENVMEHIRRQGILQAVATNKRQDYAIDICKYFGIDTYCQPIYGTDNYNKLKKSDLIRKCVSYLRVSKAVMIGDTESDKKAAEVAGVHFIGVNYGFGFKDVAGYANCPHDILKILEI